MGDDCGKQVVPLGLAAVPAWLESLRLRTLELDHDRVSAVAANKTLCPVGMVAEVRPAAGLLSALAEAVRAIGTGVLDAVVIESFADGGLGPDRRPPTPVACTGAPRVIQLQASMPWTCCSTSRMLLCVWFPSASKAAPVPRPPQPTSAILISSLPAANAVWPSSNAPIVAAAAEPLTNCLRETVQGMSCLMRGLLLEIGRGIIFAFFGRPLSTRFTA